MFKVNYIKYLSLIIFLCGISVSAEENQDSNKISSESSISSIVKPADSLKIDSLSADSLLADSTVDLFSEKLSKFKESQKALPKFSFFDSLITYFVSERFNYADKIDQAFYHDGGDFFRYDPSFFVKEYQPTPMRKTVQPFGLTGNRINYFQNQFQLAPFEHMPEPDGMYDFNDFPTALSQDVYILPGAIGQVFGGRSSVSTILTLPKRPISDLAETSFKSDQGSFGYSYTRGSYSKRFESGKDIDLSIGYRDGNGSDLGRDDDAYHYFGDFTFPMTATSSIQAIGQLYNRDGSFGVQPDLGGTSIVRERFDRNLRVAYSSQNEIGNHRNEVGYFHYRQGSYTNEPYYTRFNITGHGGYALHERGDSLAVLQAKLEADYHIYDQGASDIDRAVLTGSTNYMKKNQSHVLATSASVRYGKHIGLLPSVSFTFSKDLKSSYFLMSVGYATKEPSLHQLFKLYQSDAIYIPTAGLYADGGNGYLENEKELTATLFYELGSLASRVSFSATGGKIFDGIDWYNFDELTIVNGSPVTTKVFQPENIDINFLTLSLKGQTYFSNYFKLLGGGSYHLVDYKDIEREWYDPEFQIFAGGELHYFWESKLIDFFAYGDLTYVDKYNGYTEPDLAGEMIFNGKISMKLKDFRFNFVTMNILFNDFKNQDGLNISSRYTYYSIIWNFLN